MARRIWTKEETIIAFNVYCKIPFRSSSKTNPTIIKYANLINRSPSALNMKVGNFGRLDPELRKQGIKGLVHGSRLEEEVWEEFNGNWEDLAYESERLIARFENKQLEEVVNIDSDNLPEGVDKKRLVKTRVNQSFFRSAILSSYNSSCCITGLSIPDLLIASHIKPWALDEINRTNPRNGLCLNSLHDKAFDKGFITVSPNYKVLISKYFNDYIQDKTVYEFFISYHQKPIALPDKFYPSKEFLEYHFESIFLK